MTELIFCAGFIAFFVVLFGFLLLLRYFNYRETVLLAEKGLVKPRRERNGSGKATLVWGILIAAMGLALTLGLWPLGLTGSGSRFPLGFGPWMLIGLLPLFFGLALILIYVLTPEEKKPQTQDPAASPQALAVAEPAGELLDPLPPLDSDL